MILGVNIDIVENAPLKDLATFRMGGVARFLARVRNIEDIQAALEHAQNEKMPAWVLGGGSNTLFGDGVLNVVLLKIEIPGIEIISEDDESAFLKIGAGEEWDKVVAYAVERGLSGIECLSLIPGTTGATPVQNVGAYGQEIKNIIAEVEAFDRRTGEVKTIDNAGCEFSYRDSVFKKKGNPYIIISVTLKLSKKLHEKSRYPDVIKYFEERNIIEPSLLEIRNAVIEIRTKKLPSLVTHPNAGSFFKNSIVSAEQAKELKEAFPNMPQFPDEKGIKIPSGWLIEQAGYKGVMKETVGVSPVSALVLYNAGGATFEDLMKLKKEIVEAVKEKFGIELEQEPVAVK